MALVALGACEKQLTVNNPNSPNGQQALSSPEDLESFLGSYYLRWHAGIYGSQSNMGGMAAVQSFETYSTLSNNCIGQMSCNMRTWLRGSVQSMSVFATICQAVIACWQRTATRRCKPSRASAISSIPGPCGRGVANT